MKRKGYFHQQDMLLQYGRFLASSTDPAGSSPRAPLDRRAAIAARIARPHTRSKRLQALTESERAALNDQPQFTDEECVGYFTLMPADQALMETFTDAAVQAFFVLTLGYFKANQRFHAVTLDAVRTDLAFICEHLSLAVAPDALRIPHSRTIRQQRQFILDVTGYRYCQAAHRRAAFHVALQAARISPKPQYLVRVVLQHFATERIILPGYTISRRRLSARPSLRKRHA